MTAAGIWLVVNGDDLGLAPAINRGIARASEEGILTSASLMVRGQAADEAALWARRSSKISVGIHIDLGEWVYERGEWRQRYELVDANDADAVRAECSRQLRVFSQLVGRPPTHIDSHQHVHRSEPVRSIAQGMADELGVPLRQCDDRIVHLGGFYGQTAEGNPFPSGIEVGALISMLSRLDDGVYELGCHPADSPDVPSVYAAERVTELGALCHPSVASVIASRGIRLVPFSAIP